MIKPELMRLQLVRGISDGAIWERTDSSVPPEVRVRGRYPVTIDPGRKPVDVIYRYLLCLYGRTGDGVIFGRYVYDSWMMDDAQ